MIIKLRRWFFEKLERINRWREWHDVCEICKEETKDYVCVGCDRRICIDCESGYYEDENLCVLCRKDITPAEEAEDRRLALDNEEAEDAVS
jgi:hypothetical protein